MQTEPRRGTPGRAVGGWSRSVAAALIALLALLSVDCSAGVYRWQDERGRIYYGDSPVPGATQLLLKPERWRFSIYARVNKVYDGDTFVLDKGEKVRLLDINTPEIEHRGKPGEPGGEEAKRWMESHLLGRKVRLETGPIKRDKYKRLLAHAFTEEGAHINVMLVEEGLATADLYPPATKYLHAILQAQQRAERLKKGLWANPDYQPKPIATVLDVYTRGWQRLRGKPLAIKEGKRYFRLVFSDRIDVRIPRESLALFPSLTSYLGHEVEVRGWTSRRKNTYSILVRHPAALVRL
jgi:micrococcal nuclease